MAAFKYSQEQLQDAFWKRWQRSMEFEGYQVSDEQVRNSRREYEESGREQKLEALMAKAKAEGRPLREVMKEARTKGEFPL